MSRYLRGQPLKSKYATLTAEDNAFKLKITTKQPKKVWVDKGTEVKGSFEALCKKKGIKTYSTESEKNSALAEIKIRFLKNLIISTWRINGLTHILTNCKILSMQLIRE